MKTEESSRIEDIRLATLRKDDIQTQIDAINKAKKDETEKHYSDG